MWAGGGKEENHTLIEGRKYLASLLELSLPAVFTLTRCFFSLFHSSYSLSPAPLHLLLAPSVCLSFDVSHAG